MTDAYGALLSPAGRRDPYPLYRALRRAGPVVPIGEGAYAVVGYAAADAILRAPAVRVVDAAMMDATWAGWRENRAVASIATSMLRANPPDHTRMRRAAAGAFTARRVAALTSVVEAQADALVAALRDHDGPVDFMDAFAFPLPIGVICALIGVPAADHGWFRQRSADLTAVLEAEIDLDELAAAHRGAEEIEAYLRDLVAERRRTPRDDLTSALVGALDGDELIANLLLLLVAGFETTTNLLGNGLVTLLDHPPAADALRARPAEADAFVEELLRYDSPVQLTSRVLVRDLDVPGTGRVPAGSWLLLLLGAANRDPERFREPDRFDPWRADGGPLSFGAGPHFCLGAALARLEARVAFPRLLDAGLVGAGAPIRRDRLTLRGYATLPVSVVGRPR